MITIAICDDEKYILDKLKRLAVGFFQRKKVEVKVIVFRSGEELLDYQQNIDILFLDIQMDGIDGMETARRLRNRNYRGYLIFITVLREMVFEAFVVQPYDYLLKPMKEEAFVKTMERLFASMQEERAASLLVQRGYESSLVPFGDIIFCEIIDRKIYLHLKTGEVIDYYDRLERLETKLDSRFYKCHRSYLINLNYLKSYKNGMAYMINDKAIPVSRLRGKEFSGVILNYMKEWGT